MKILICLSCGYENQEGEVECMGCGYPIGNDSEGIYGDVKIIEVE